MSDSSASAEPPASLQQQIDAICDRFEAAIKADASTKIEDFLEDLPGDHSHALLKALIALEIHHRPGATVTPADYRQRFGSAFDAIEASLFPEEQPTVPPNLAERAPLPPSAEVQEAEPFAPDAARLQTAAAGVGGQLNTLVSMNCCRKSLGGGWGSSTRHDSRNSIELSP